jgi:hypothetical protein
VVPKHLTRLELGLHLQVLRQLICRVKAVLVTREVRGMQELPVAAAAEAEAEAFRPKVTHPVVPAAPEVLATSDPPAVAVVVGAPILLVAQVITAAPAARVTKGTSGIQVLPLPRFAALFRVALGVTVETGATLVLAVPVVAVAVYMAFTVPRAVLVVPVGVKAVAPATPVGVVADSVAAVELAVAARVARVVAVA